MIQTLLAPKKRLGDSLRKNIDPSSLPLLEQEIWNVFAKRNKQLSQLIAKTWLDGTKLTEEDVKNLFKDENLRIIIDPNPYDNDKLDDTETPHPRPDDPHNPHSYVGYWTIPDEIGHEPIGLYIPYPERPPEEDVSSQELQEWIEQDSSIAPFYPTNVWIPYTC